MNRSYTTLYGIITRSLSAKFQRAECYQSTQFITSLQYRKETSLDKLFRNRTRSCTNTLNKPGNSSSKKNSLSKKARLSKQNSCPDTSCRDSRESKSHSFPRNYSEYQNHGECMDIRELSNLDMDDRDIVHFIKEDKMT